MFEREEDGIMRRPLHKISTPSTGSVRATDLRAAAVDFCFEDDACGVPSDGRVVPIVSMLRRGTTAAPGRRPPVGRRLRDVSPESPLPRESRIVFRAGSGLAFR